MQKTKIACPLCKSVFASAEAAAVGKSIRCASCGAPFTVVANDLRCAEAPDASPAATKDEPWWVQDQQQLPTAVPVSAHPTPPKAEEPVSTPVGRSRTGAAKQPRIQVQAVPAPRPALQLPANTRLIVVGLSVAIVVLVLGVGAAVAVMIFKTGDDQSSMALAPDTPEPIKAAPLPPNKEKGDAARNRVPQPVEPRPADLAQQPQQPGPEPKDRAKEPAPKPVVPNEPPPPPKANKKSAAPIQKRLIDDAIARGVEFIRAEQAKDGSWIGFGRLPKVALKQNLFGAPHQLGFTALAGLTLLECGVPADDPQVVKAASFVRKYWQSNTQTYELSLILLFLDRLGEKKDKSIIKSMGLRLIAGQTANGGWTYGCPTLTKEQETKLITALNKERKALPTAIDQKSPSLPIPVDKGTKQTLPVPIDKGDKQTPSGTTPKLSPTQVDKSKNEEPFEGSRVSSDEDEVYLVAFQAPGKKQPKGLAAPNGVVDDNSNTQFAMLALWAARRHDLPVEKSLALSELRFRASQLSTGGWSYLFNLPIGMEKPSMTCVGLLGIALGKGSAKEAAIRENIPDDSKSPVVKAIGLDEQITKGLGALSLEDATIGMKNNSLYFIWSIERVGVLYGLSKIGGRDWYQWGAGMLIPEQNPSGSWETHSYVGSSAIIDTCFALLFLKRANFAQDLTDLNLFQVTPK
jgi:hypothetical protein